MDRVVGLSKLFKFGRSPDRDLARDTLLALKEQGRPVELELPNARKTGGMKLLAVVESVTDEEVRIGRPYIGDESQTVCKGERVRLHLATSRGLVEGDGVCRGRARIVRVDGSEAFGYRVTLPDTLGPATIPQPKPKATAAKPAAARPAPRPAASRTLPEAELLTDSRTGKVFGRIEDVTPLAVRILCRNAGDKLTEGQLAHFKARFGVPIGVVKEMAKVTMITPSERPGHTVVTLLFCRRVSAFEGLAKEAERRRGAA